MTNYPTRILSHGPLSSSVSTQNGLDANLEQALPLDDPMSSTSMPESWVRGAMAIRISSLLGGHSAVRVEVLTSLADLLKANIVPLVPLYGSVSASGDLMPLAYVGGVLLGKRNIKAWTGTKNARSLKRSSAALTDAGLTPLTLEPKEGLSIVNGTAFSCAVAALAMHDANGLAIMTQILTAMSVEALSGTDEYFHPFTAQVRPHPGQVRHILQRTTEVFVANRLID